jgi:hypothetical protein
VHDLVSAANIEVDTIAPRAFGDGLDNYTAGLRTALGKYYV